jgi:hypothetical protein
MPHSRVPLLGVIRMVVSHVSPGFDWALTSGINPEGCATLTWSDEVGVEPLSVPARG